MMNENKVPSKAKLKYEQILRDLRNPVKKAVRTQKVADKLSTLFRIIILIGLSFVIIFPIFQQISLAFRHPADIQNKLVIWIPETSSILNFKIAYKMLDYLNSLFNNIRVSLIVMLGQVTCSVLAGYALARLKFKGSNLIFVLLLATFIIPPQAVSVSRMLYFFSKR
jgi:multiple sugar transport system permease protein